jgi:hypothetical protein
MRAILLGGVLFACATAGAQPGVMTSRVPPGAVSRPFVQGVTLPFPGWALISDSARWRQLLEQQALIQSYEPGDRAVERQLGPLPKGWAPWMDVDFTRHEVLLVGLEATSGCGNQFDIIAKISTTTKERVAYLDPTPFREELTCSGYAQPIDAVVIPRSDKPLRIVMRDQAGHPTTRHEPPPAQWWVQVSLDAALDPSTEMVRAHARAVSRRALALDTTAGPRAYSAIARAIYLKSDDWVWVTMRGEDWVKTALGQNPAATRDLETLAWLSSGEPYSPSKAERKARVLLLPRFGLQIARDSSAPLPWLDALTESLTYEDAYGRPDLTPMHPDVAMALARNPAIQRSREVLRRLTMYTYRYPEARRVACLAWAERYPPSYQYPPDAQGRVYTGSPECPASGARAPAR